MLTLIRKAYTARDYIKFAIDRYHRGGVYKTIVGKSWILIEPLSSMLIYYFLIAIIFKSGAVGDINYFVVIMTGLIHYLFFQQALTASCDAILAQESILLQLNIEPIVFCAITVFTSMYDFLVMLILFTVIYVALGPPPTVNLLFYPAILLVLVIIVWTWTIILALLNIFFRDIAKIVSILLRILMYISPVIYTMDFVPLDTATMPFKSLYYLNPLASLFALFQWSLLGGEFPPTFSLINLLVFVIGSTLLSSWLYNRLRPKITKAF